jgi:hypothetical protein
MPSFAPLLLTVLFAGAPLPAAAALDAPTRHVRTTDKSIKHLLARGYHRSPTFAALITRLQESDVFVYIQEVPRLPGGLEGRMMMLPRTHGFRYVRIQIVLRGAADDAIAVLGHELQHAIEVADARDVGDQDALAQLYQRIGMRGGPHVYDTIAAQETGRTVLKELLAA